MTKSTKSKKIRQANDADISANSSTSSNDFPYPSVCSSVTIRTFAQIFFFPGASILSPKIPFLRTSLQIRSSITRGILKRFSKSCSEYVRSYEKYARSNFSSAPRNCRVIISAPESSHYSIRLIIWIVFTHHSCYYPARDDDCN